MATVTVAVSVGSTLDGAETTVIFAALPVSCGLLDDGAVGSRDFPGSQNMKAKAVNDTRGNSSGFRLGEK
jgi:hypothetical protein